MHDCFIGILNDYDQSELNELHLSTYVDRLFERSAHSRAMVAFSGSFHAVQPIDYIDRRRGLATLFSFCPECGEKIQWKKIRKEISEKSELFG